MFDLDVDTILFTKEQVRKLGLWGTKFVYNVDELDDILKK